MKVLTLLGLARRSGSLVWGFDAVLRQVKAGDALLIVMAVDASAATQRRVLSSLDASSSYAVFSSKVKLGEAIGRSETAVVAITDASFAKGLKKAFLEMGVEVEKGRGLIDKSTSV